MLERGWAGARLGWSAAGPERGWAGARLGRS